MAENENKQPFMLLPTVESRIIAGILSFFGIMIVLAWVAINEEARMEEFQGRFTGRSIENGATLWENNCSTCHGQNGYGQENRAPALNSAHFFSYSYVASFETDISVLETRLETDENLTAEEQAEIEAQIERLNREQQDLTEALLYDYQSDLDQRQAALNVIDQRITTEFSDYEFNYDQIQVTQISSPNLLDFAVGDLIAQQERLEEEQAATTDTAQLEQIEADLAAIEADLAALEPIANERADLNEEVVLFRRMMDAHAEVQALREQIDAVEADLAALPEAPAEGADPDAVTRSSLQDELDQLDASLGAAEDTRDEARDALIEERLIIAPYEPDRYEDGRLAELAWGGTLEQMVVTTLIHGRPTSGNYWSASEGMAAWSQDAGGPLRRDEVQNLTDFILNWDKGDGWTVEDQRQVRQYAIEPVAPSAVAGAPSGFPAVSEEVPDAAEDIDAVVAAIEDLQNLPAEEIPEGVAVWDVAAGEDAYAANGCTACHMMDGSGTGPTPQGIFTRAQGYADNNEDIPGARYYLVQSIMAPNAFAADGYQVGAMPMNYPDTLTTDEMANIIAYLESLD
jgi:mono/diheme cytochrome c family protein